jgi:glucuronoarabinoxylan endo-1,4-beta-xylanase
MSGGYNVAPLLMAIVLAMPLCTDTHAGGTVDPYYRYQQIEGFGAAGAWYGGWLTAHPKRNELYNLLFGQLSLDIYRIRDTYQIDSGSMSTDATIITKANATLSQPLKVMISSWSPPASLKSNGSTAGGTLAKDASSNYRYADFAQWWVDSLNAYANLGIRADYINMQNEPDYLDTWDTCKFTPSETATFAGYNRAFDALAHAIGAVSNPPRLLAPEAAGFGASAGYIDTLLDRTPVYAYSHHLYGDGSGNNPDGYISGMTSFAARYSDKPRMQTEFSNTSDTGTFNDAILLALLMHNSLTVENVSVYMYWDLFWASPGGLISLDNPWGSNPGYTIRPVYYAFRHYSAFIEPGWRRIAASSGNANLRISAYESPDRHSLTAVIINPTASAQAMTLSPSNFSFSSGSIYRSSASENAVLVGSFTPSQSMTIPASSITTITMSGTFVPPAMAPDPMTWASAPAATGLLSVAMTATQVTAGTQSAEYYFACVSGSGHDSGWQTARAYSDAGLAINSTYAYTVKARDGADHSRETAPSAVAYVTTHAVPAPAAMEAYWPLNETAGVAVLDMSGNCNDGTVEGAGGPNAAWTAGRFGNGLSFEAGGCVRVPDNSTIDFGDEFMSVSFWLKEPASIAADTTHRILLKGTFGAPADSGDGRRYEFYRTRDTGGSDLFHMVTSDGAATGVVSVDSSLVCTGQWVHVVGVRERDDGRWLRLYVNGVLKAGGFDWAGDLSNGEPLLMGGGGMTGALDDVRVYRAALSSDEVMALYLGIWNVDDCPPTPSPMSFSVAPHATNASTITMTAAPARDPSGVEYYFACTAGGGHDSGWQDGRVYTDTGLANNTTYTYQVLARDKSPQQYETSWSHEAGAATPRYDCTMSKAADLDSSCQVDFVDYVMLSGQWGVILPPSVETVINGDLTYDMVPGWQVYDQPSATGAFFSWYDNAVGNPVGSAGIGSDSSEAGTSGHYFYQVMPVIIGMQYTLSAEWMGDMSEAGLAPGCMQWARVLVFFADSNDPAAWTSLDSPDSIMYGKSFGTVSLNIGISGTWDWQRVTASPVNGPAGGTFTATDKYMIVAFESGGLTGSGVGFSYLDNISVMRPACPQSDLNGDCSLDFADLFRFALDWLTCDRNPPAECWQ